MLPCPVRIFHAFYVCVYRGVTSYNAENVEALSWTLNREAAEWFAHRRGENGAVYEAPHGAHTAAGAGTGNNLSM